MKRARRLVACSILGVALVGCSSEKKQPVVYRAYSEAEESAIRKQVASLKGLEFVCVTKFQDAYRSGFFDACVQFNDGMEIAGGCAHLMGQLFLPTQALEQGLKQCGVRPDN